MEPSVLFMLISLIIFTGFFSLILFKKTFIPDVLILMFFGYILTRIFSIFSNLKSISSFMAHLALAIILFETGLNIHVSELMKNLRKGFVLATLSFTLSSLAIASVVYFGLKFNLLSSLLLGFLLGGTSAGIVIPIANSLPISKDNIMLLEMESTITNVYNTVLALSLADLIYKSASFNIRYALNAVLSAFSIGIVLGMIWGLFWIFALKRLQKHKFSYMITLAALFMLYGFVEFVKANGGVSALTFGIILGNSKGLSRIINIKSIRTRMLSRLHEEMSFLVRTFFFLYLGTVLQFPKSTKIWIISLIILLAIFVARLITIFMLKLEDIFIAFIPRGLSEAVVVSMILNLGIIYSKTMSNLTAITILLTNLMTSFMLIYMFKFNRKSIKNAN